MMELLFLLIFLTITQRGGRFLFFNYLSLARLRR